MKEKGFVPPPLKEIHLLDTHSGVFKRVLVLENEAAAVKALRDPLEAQYFEIVFVRSGAEAIREVMERDFDLILCNMNNFIFGGEMFYHAVQRVRPHLCSRIIYLVDDRGDTKTAAFIRKVNGIELWKPFETHVLLETIGLAFRKQSRAGARSSFRSVARKSSEPGDMEQLTLSDSRKNIALETVMDLCIRSARNSIRIGTGYLSFHERLLTSLLQAAQRGISVEILGPARNADRGIPKLHQTKVRLLSGGVRLYETDLLKEPGRFVIIDEHLVCLTRSNFGPAHLNLYQAEFAARLAGEFEKMKSTARKVSPAVENLMQADVVKTPETVERSAPVRRAERSITEMFTKLTRLFAPASAKSN